MDGDFFIGLKRRCAGRWGTVIENVFSGISAHRKDDDRAQQDYRKIAIFPAQLRHIFEIHAVPAHNQCERQKNGGNHGQDFHDFILADVNLGLVDLPELRGIFPEHKGLLMQPSHPLAEKTEGSQFIPGEKT